MPTGNELISWANDHQWLAWAVASALLNLALTKKSMIDEWCESKPRLAAVLKVVRGLGIDPWHLLTAISLLVTKKVPQSKRWEKQ